jgi:hypothetical protein
MTAPAWFAAALIPMAVSQVVRLHQHDPGAWIFWDYAGRLAGLAMLVAIPSARVVAFRRETLRMAVWKLPLWIAGIVIADRYLGRWIGTTINTLLPATALGGYPRESGSLYLIDVVFGLALVAYSEEVFFRKCARDLFKIYLGDGGLLVFVTSLLFGAYHWWSGVGNIVVAVILGALLMIFFQRSEALWPVVLGHYLTDIFDFA